MEQNSCSRCHGKLWAIVGWRTGSSIWWTCSSWKKKCFQMEIIRFPLRFLERIWFFTTQKSLTCSFLIALILFQFLYIMTILKHNQTKIFIFRINILKFQSFKMWSKFFHPSPTISHTLTHQNHFFVQLIASKH